MSGPVPSPSMNGMMGLVGHVELAVAQRDPGPALRDAHRVLGSSMLASSNGRRF